MSMTGPPAASSWAGTRFPENNAGIADTDEMRLVIVANAPLELFAMDGCPGVYRVGTSWSNPTNQLKGDADAASCYPSRRSGPIRSTGVRAGCLLRIPLHRARGGLLGDVRVRSHPGVRWLGR
jgi:hypothetical protein